MNSNLMRSMTVLPCLYLGLTLSAQASSRDTYYGTAPASLDFPADRLAAKETTAEKREELRYLSDENPFPKGNLSSVDPISKKKVDRVAVGPAFKTRAYGSGYDYYRYVTFFNVAYRKERFYELPIQRAYCYDKSELFGNYSSSDTFTATVEASASLEGLGLSASISQSSTLSTGRGIAAPGGIVADYIPMITFHDWTGRTYIQLYNSKTDRVQLLTKEIKESAWWVFALFPLAAHEQYPMPFRIRGADRTFSVERDVLEQCDPQFGAR